MMTGVYLSAAGAAVQDYRMDVIANNLANADSVGFKRDLALFVEREAEARLKDRYRHLRAEPHDEIGGGIFLAQTYTVHEPGAMAETGNPFDLALGSDGFFMLRDAAGRSLFTRAGNFRLNAQGELVSADGLSRVLDADGSPILIEDPANVTVNAEGAVMQDGQELTRLGVRRFADPRVLRKAGAGLFEAPAGTPGEPAAVPDVRQGYLEASASGSRMIQDLVDMVSVQRLYEMNLHALRVQDEMLGRTVTRLTAAG